MSRIAICCQLDKKCFKEMCFVQMFIRGFLARRFRIAMIGAVALAMALELAIAASPAQAQEFTSLYSLTGGTGGEYAQGGVAVDAKGNVYGTTELGSAGDCDSGCGTAFKLVGGCSRSFGR
jgi:hypothetical protein